METEKTGAKPKPRPGNLHRRDEAPAEQAQAQDAHAVLPILSALPCSLGRQWVHHRVVHGRYPPAGEREQLHRQERIVLGVRCLPVHRQHLGQLRRVQARVAGSPCCAGRADAEGHRGRLKAYGGDWEKVAAAHFAGGGWVAKHPDKSTWGQNPVPGSKNPQVSAYVASVFKKAGQGTSVKGTSARWCPGATGGSGGVPQASDASIDEQVAANYGYLAGYLSDREVGPILRQAAKEGWGTAQLQGAIFKTNWYKTHSDTVRQFDATSSWTRHAQKQQIASQVAALQAQVRNVGMTIDPKRLSKIAVDSLRFGWNSQQITAAIGAEGKFDT